MRQLKTKQRVTNNLTLGCRRERNPEYTLGTDLDKRRDVD